MTLTGNRKSPSIIVRNTGNLPFKTARKVTLRGLKCLGPDSFALLHGSFITGKRVGPKTISDIDLIVVSPRFNGVTASHRRSLFFSCAKIRNQEAWDLFCITSDRWKTLLANGSPEFKRVISSGIVIGA